MLVDDSDDLRLLVRTFLERSGLEVVDEGGNGREAIALARTHRPDLLLLDVSMPEMDGLEALPQVTAASPHTRVVMFTGFEQQGLDDRVRRLGATALLEKSMSMRSLAPRLLELLGQPAPVRGEPRPSAPSAEHAFGDATESAASVVLDEHRERFREVFEEAAIGMGTMTLAGRLVRANRALAELVELAPDDLVGTAYRDLVVDDGERPFEDQLAAALERGVGMVQFEHGLLRMPASRRVLTTLAPIRDSSGTPLYLFAQLQDVSAQRAAEAALRQSEERFRLLVEGVSDYAIFMLDPSGKVQSWNAGAQRMKGYGAHEIIGQHFRRFYPVDLQRAGHPEHELELAIRDGRYEEEGWRVRKDGSRFYANVVITAIHDPSGHHVGFAKITRDVTERQRLQDERESAAIALEHANAELEAANQRLARAAADQAQLVATTAHELRTPIAILSGAVQTFADQHELAGDEREQMLASMSTNAARLKRLLDDLLTAARLDAQAVALDLRPMPVAPVLAQAVAGARHRYPSLELTLVEPDPDLWVRADAGRFGQIVDNLVNNAVNHGRPPVEVSAVRVGDEVEIRVLDSGPGVPTDLRERLFDRYVTAARSGTGLGLYIVRELAQAHGGDARYEPGPPPAFVVTLPGGGKPSEGTVRTDGGDRPAPGLDVRSRVF